MPKPRRAVDPTGIGRTLTAPVPGPRWSAAAAVSKRLAVAEACSAVVPRSRARATRPMGGCIGRGPADGAGRRESIGDSRAGIRIPGPTPTTVRKVPTVAGRGARATPGGATAPALADAARSRVESRPATPQSLMAARIRMRAESPSVHCTTRSRVVVAIANGCGRRPATMTAMTARRDRPSQVRPRPPSSGRPRQLPAAPRRSGAARTVGPRAPEPARGMALPVRLALLVAVMVLTAVVITTVTGFLPRVVSSIGTALGGITATVLATPTPSATLVDVPAAPTLVAPESPYTNKATAALSGTVPLAFAGRDGFVVRVSIALPEQEPVVVRELPVNETPSFVVSDVPLEPGRNDVSATIAGPGVESEPSAMVTFILDTTKPKVTIVSPANGATVNGRTATINGKTEAGATVVARNEATGTTATAKSGANRAFVIVVPISSGTNGISLTATDLAGNVGSSVLTVRRGSGALTVNVSASAYQISARRLPSTIVLRALVNDPSGRPLAGVSVTFTLSIPGVQGISGDDVTNSAGLATFRTIIPAGATAGLTGPVTASVSTPEFGDARGLASITITK